MPMLTFALLMSAEAMATGQRPSVPWADLQRHEYSGLNSVLIPDRQLTALPDAQVVEDPRVVSGGDRPVDPCNRLYLLAPETDAD